MYWANLENDKIPPSPGGKAFCPLCKQSVIAKCGEIYKWHWAHISNKDWDEWYESESKWH